METERILFMPTPAFCLLFVAMLYSNFLNSTWKTSTPWAPSLKYGITFLNSSVSLNSICAFTLDHPTNAWNVGPSSPLSPFQISSCFTSSIVHAPATPWASFAVSRPRERNLAKLELKAAVSKDLGKRTVMHSVTGAERGTDDGVEEGRGMWKMTGAPLRRGRSFSRNGP